MRKRITLVGNSPGTYVCKINRAVIRNGTAIWHVTFRSQHIYLLCFWRIFTRRGT